MRVPCAADMECLTTFHCAHAVLHETLWWHTVPTGTPLFNAANVLSCADVGCLAAISGIYVRAAWETEYTFADESMWGYQGRESGKVLLTVFNIDLTADLANGYEVGEGTLGVCGSGLDYIACVCD